MTTHGHLCILVLRPWIDYHCMIRMVKHVTKSCFLYTSQLKTSCRNPYGKTQYMVDAAPGKVTAHLSTETWIDWSIHLMVHPSIHIASEAPRKSPSSSGHQNCPGDASNGYFWACFFSAFDFNVFGTCPVVDTGDLSTHESINRSTDRLIYPPKRG